MNKLKDQDGFFPFLIISFIEADKISTYEEVGYTCKLDDPINEIFSAEKDVYTREEVVEEFNKILNGEAPHASFQSLVDKQMYSAEELRDLF